MAPKPFAPRRKSIWSPSPRLPRNQKKSRDLTMLPPSDARGNPRPTLERRPAAGRPFTFHLRICPPLPLASRTIPCRRRRVFVCEGAAVSVHRCDLALTPPAFTLEE